MADEVGQEVESKISSPEKPTPQSEKKKGGRELNSGREQSQRFFTERKMSEPILDGFMLGMGSSLDQRDEKGRLTNPAGEYIIVDREKDPKLQALIERVRQIRTQHGEYRTAFEIARLVDQETGDPEAALKREQGFSGVIEEPTSGLVFKVEELEGVNPRTGLKAKTWATPLGYFTGKERIPGVCRHKALLFHVLAQEAELKSSLVRGSHMDSKTDNIVGHIWNEVEIPQQGTLVVDTALNPPTEHSFDEFIKNGGYPKPESVEGKPTLSGHIYSQEGKGAVYTIPFKTK